MRATPDPTAAGHAVYTKGLLTLYDMAVLGLSCRFAWRCPARRILTLYDRYVSANHLDVGVGTGWFLDHCCFPSDKPRLGLLDFNSNCLDWTARRVARYRPEIHRANVLEPIQWGAEKFDSASLSLLLHCLPGTIETKGAVLKHLKALLNPGAVVFGATVLRGGVSRNWLARRLMAFYNAAGIFSNSKDDRVGLMRMLSQHLSWPCVEVAGCMALFSGRIGGLHTCTP